MAAQKCTEAGCKGWAIANGKCAKHGGAVVVQKQRNVVFQTSNDNGKTWANVDDKKMKTWLEGLCDQAQKANTPAMISAMQDGAGGGRTKQSNIKGMGVVYHASQGAAGKAGALTVFWVENVKDTVQPCAVGQHDGPASYQLSWASPLWNCGKKFAF